MLCALSRKSTDPLMASRAVSGWTTGHRAGRGSARSGDFSALTPWRGLFVQCRRVGKAHAVRRDRWRREGVVVAAVAGKDTMVLFGRL